MKIGAESFPVRERGLKPQRIKKLGGLKMVVPRAGTWIETHGALFKFFGNCVVPRAGTWIETSATASQKVIGLSFPVRERGLKPSINIATINRTMSFPVRERGLKHIFTIPSCSVQYRRSPCGNVD